MVNTPKISRIAWLRDRLFEGNSSVKDFERDAPPLTPLHLNLGIDFGTSFTKLCYRDAATEISGIVAFSNSAATSLVPSLVHVDTSGALSIPQDGNQNCERYLKMRLARLDTAHPPDDLHKIKTLSAWFLATVITNAKCWILEHKSSLTKGRRIHWSANVGVPVAYCDSPSLLDFHEVLALAWHWAETVIPDTLQSAMKAYAHAVSPALIKNSPCQVVAEIGAAVLSFVSSREAEEGVYAYLDIGGGTVDSVVFYFSRGFPIAFYSGKVEALGVEAIAQDVALSDFTRFSSALVCNHLTDLDTHHLIPKRNALQKQVAETIVNAKKKDGRDWLQEEVQPIIRRLTNIDPSRAKKFCIFIGGGGAPSEWYRSAVLEMHEERQHFNAGIPPYILGEIRKPKDLEMSGIVEKDFHRFAIAYGLSIPYGERPEQTIQLPSEFAPVARPRRTIAMTVDYCDSKDAYD